MSNNQNPRCLHCADEFTADKTEAAQYMGFGTHAHCRALILESEPRAGDVYANLLRLNQKELCDLARVANIKFSFNVETDKGPRRKFFHNSFLVARLAAAKLGKLPETDETDTDETAEEEPTVPKTETKTMGLEAMLLELARNAAREVANEVLAQIPAAGPSVIEWKVNNVKFAVTEGTHHAALVELLDTVKAGFNNLYCVGPAGTGKSTLGGQLAKALRPETHPEGLPFGEISCSGGVEEWQFLGRSFPNLTTGEAVYQASQFIHMYENGGVFLIDEIDGADANVLVVLNSALANGHLAVPSRTSNPIAHRHPHFYLIAAANTYGHGANMQYQGRNPLDAATLDRFVGAIIPVEYDRDLEAKIVPEETIRAQVWAMRDRVESLKLRRIVGTRTLIAVAKHVRAGKTLKQAVQRVTMGWSADEISKVCAA